MVIGTAATGRRPSPSSSPVAVQPAPPALPGEAVGADPLMGDGAGIMVQIPHKFFLKESSRLGYRLPEKGRDEEEVAPPTTAPAPSTISADGRRGKVPFAPATPAAARCLLAAWITS